MGGYFSTVCIVVYTFFTLGLRAQPANVDSLKNVLANASHDSVRFAAAKALLFHFQVTDPARQGKQWAIHLVEIGKRLGPERTMDALLNVANTWSRQNRLDSVEFYAGQALDLSRKTGNSVFEGRALTTLGGVYEKRGELAKAIESYKTAIPKVKDRRDSLFLLNNLGLAHTRLNNPESALDAYLAALRLTDQSQPNRLTAVVCGNLSRVYEVMGKLPEAVQYLEKSIDIKEKIGDKPGLLFGYNQIAALLFFKKIDTEKGLEFSRKALQAARELRDTFMILEVLTNLSSMHMEQKRYEAASVFLQEGLQLIGNAPEQKESKAHFLKNLAVIENEKSNHGAALRYVQQALDIWPKEVLSGKQEIYFELFTAHKGMGNYKAALEIHEQYEALKDSLNNADRLTKLAELDSKYQTAEKDKSIALLEKDKLAQAAEIQQRRAQVLYVSLAALAVLLLAGLFYARNRYQQNLRLERIRTSIASDLHDEVGSSLSRLNFLIGSLDMEAAPERTSQNIEKSKEIMQKPPPTSAMWCGRWMPAATKPAICSTAWKILHTICSTLGT
jgi:two-component system sensor histidine kinase UhpB